MEAFFAEGGKIPNGPCYAGTPINVEGGVDKTVDILDRLRSPSQGRSGVGKRGGRARHGKYILERSVGVERFNARPSLSIARVPKGVDL